MKNFFEKKKKKITYENFDNYWVQKIELKKIDKRFHYFLEKCKGKKVLHFGCTDWPIFDPQKNLHIELSKHTDFIHGFDIDIEGIENLKKFVNQPYYSSYEQIPDDIIFDVCLIPETIEHVDNVRSFFENISKINAKLFIITAPNCFAPEFITRNSNKENMFIEVVHPDHNYWFSPHTLKNCIAKYSTLNVQKVLLLENETMICCEATK